MPITLLDPPYVKLRFAPNVSLSYSPAATAEVAALPGAQWLELDAMFPGLKLVPMLRNVTAATVNGIVLRAQMRTPGYVPARFLSMFRVVLPPMSTWEPPPPSDPADVRAMLESAFATRLPVDRVTVELHLVSPPVSDDPPAGTGKELNHLHEPPKGIGVEAVWDLPGGQGQGEAFAVVEQGWKVEHADFKGTAGADGVPDLAVEKLELADWGEETAVDHGTMTLGTIAARKNEVFGLGVAPQAAKVLLACERRPGVVAAMTETALFDAIKALVAELPGSVLLLEVEKVVDKPGEDDWDIKGPCETIPELLDLIRLAVACHIVVVEAAGNGGVLKKEASSTPADEIVGTGELHLDADTDLASVDSGALLVGRANWKPGASYAAGDSGTYHDLPDHACSGSRIDCFAWGSSVHAASVLESGTDPTGWSDEGSSFSGTSAASAILAGVAIVTQAMYRLATGGSYLTPWHMRALLRDRTAGKHTPLGSETGTPPAEYDVVGVMPALKHVAVDFGLLPDVYIRDTIADDGEPTAGKLSKSPDIIVRTTALTKAPDDTFGEPSMTAADDDLSEKPVEGGPAQLFVRVRNRGGTDANGAEVTVYWSEPSALLTPSLWKTNKIGTAVVDVPADDKFVVAGPIDWAAAPAAGHYCFIATVDHPLDGVVVPESYEEWTYFKYAVARENNLAWRNFNVMEVPTTDGGGGDGGGGGGDGGGGGGDGGGSATSTVSGGGSGGGATGPAEVEPLEAIVAGPDEGPGEVMELRVVARLPHGADLHVELPEGLAGRMPLPVGTYETDADRGTRRGRLRGTGASRIGEALVRARERHRVRLLVCLPLRVRRGRYEVALEQRQDGQTLGRVTWRLDVGSSRRPGDGADQPVGPA